jgi:hypothetical protein
MQDPFYESLRTKQQVSRARVRLLLEALQFASIIIFSSQHSKYTCTRGAVELPHTCWHIYMIAHTSTTVYRIDYTTIANNTASCSFILQLGYLVFSGARRTEGIGAAAFVVQSGVKDPQYVTDRILDYVRELRTVLTSMRRSQFSDFVGGLVEKKLEPDQRLAQEVWMYLHVYALCYAYCRYMLRLSCYC